ncbi:hypothetical protein [Alteromonas sp. PRIM-21]|uniref:hypothetical protein n=1 Tax=Alteromonas sp. PRIM-21 TaxID=1454978 RepID=UPI0022B97BAF|nr:hypothetical protein [Alteromonas sp. PRIM-21]MCZ8530189.1 hypothetical protein [Alteromonas sp. PRIM-21]
MKYHKKILSTIGEVTSDHFAEMLIATVVNGDVVDSVGYDIKCKDGRLIEVRFRVEGTNAKPRALP